MINLTFKKLTHKRQCSVARCNNVNSYMVFRGRDAMNSPMFLCEDCIKDIVLGYIDAVGVDKAKETLADVIAKFDMKDIKEKSAEIETQKAVEAVKETVEHEQVSLEDELLAMTEEVTEAPKASKKKKGK